MGLGTPSAGLSPSIPRAQGHLALLLLPRNLILKMVVLGLLCYQWLSRRVVCSTEEVSAAAPGPGSACVSGRATPTRPSLAQGARSKAKAAVPAPAGSRGRGLAAGALPDSTTGTIHSFAGERGATAGQGHPKPGVAGERGAGEEKVLQPLTLHGGHGKVMGEEKPCCPLDATFACLPSAGRRVWGRTCTASW